MGNKKTIGEEKNSNNNNNRNNNSKNTIIVTICKSGIICLAEFARLARLYFDTC